MDTSIIIAGQSHGYGFPQRKRIASKRERTILRQVYGVIPVPNKSFGSQLVSLQQCNYLADAYENIDIGVIAGQSNCLGKH